MSKKHSPLHKLKDGRLTEPMDRNSKGYQDLKLLIKGKVAATSVKDKIEIALWALEYEMEDYLKQSEVLVSVGSFISQFIQSVDITQKDFADFIDLNPSNLSKVLSGDRRLSLELAIILEKISSISAELWLAVQYKNEVVSLKKTKESSFKRFSLNNLTARSSGH